MSVLMVTSLGDLVVDLHTDKCPLTCKNFLKLCKIKYYNGCLFHTVQKDFTAQTGDPTGTGAGGDSVYKFLYGDQARFFSDEIHNDLKHKRTGTVAMASAGENLNASQFYITLRDDLDYLDGKHTVFGEVAEGHETVTRINEAYVDQNNRPYKNVRIKHTYVLDDPFDDPPQLAELIPDASPEGKPKDEVDVDVRLEDDWVPMDEQLAPGELEEVLRAKDAHSSAVVLETIGDIPDAEIRPPDNVLFVCKLNPVTEDEDLHTIFSRFGTVLSAEIIRDYKTGDSLCYAFIEFETKEACEQAYFKMDNALIDDRRIHVDFSQSVAKLWSQYRHKGQASKGRGCFKCGALDHIAKDCTGGGPNTKPQSAKYILKDDNRQHGGDNTRYDMVFSDDKPESPGRGTEHRCRNQDYRADKHASRQTSEELGSRSLRDQIKRGRNNKDEHKVGTKSHRDDQQIRACKYGDRDDREVQWDREKHVERGKEDRYNYSKKEERGHGWRDMSERKVDRRDERDYGREDGEKRRKIGIDDYGRRDKKDDRDYRRYEESDRKNDRGRHDEESDRRRMRDNLSHRNRNDDEERSGRKEEHGQRRRDNEFDDRRHRSDRR